MNNRINFLPIGTVVLLKGATKRLMITGYCSYDKSNQSKAYDYCGCLYPEGIITSDELALFDNSQIEKVFFMGYSDDEDKEFKNKLVSSVVHIMQNQQQNTKVQTGQIIQDNQEKRNN